MKKNTYFKEIKPLKFPKMSGNISLKSGTDCLKKLRIMVQIQGKEARKKEKNDLKEEIEMMMYELEKADKNVLRNSRIYKDIKGGLYA